MPTVWRLLVTASVLAAYEVSLPRYHRSVGRIEPQDLVVLR